MDAERDKLIKEYQEAILGIVMAMRILDAHDISRLLKDIEHADAFGPFVDPTVWKRARTKMLEDAELLRAALPLKAMAERFKHARMVPDHD